MATAQHVPKIRIHIDLAGGVRQVSGKEQESRQINDMPGTV